MNKMNNKIKTMLIGAMAIVGVAVVIYFWKYMKEK